MDNATIIGAKGLGGHMGMKLLRANGKLHERLAPFRTNTIFKDDDWKRMDTEHIVPMATRTLKAYQDLIDAGLVYDVGGIGISKVEWNIEGGMSDANVSMNISAAGEKDLIDYERDSLPNPIIYKDIEFDLRDLNASQVAGNNIDLSNTDAAARKVATTMEEITVNGYAHKLGGSYIYGYTSHPDRIRTTGFETIPFNKENAEAMVLAMIGDLEKADYKDGPFNLYIPTGYSTELYRRFGDGSAEVLKDWLHRVDLIEKITPTSALRPGNMTLVQMTRDVIDVVVGLPLEPIEWQSMGGMVTSIRLLTATAPRIKKRITKSGDGYQVGISHMKFQGN